jgi:peroxiredoxin
LAAVLENGDPIPDVSVQRAPGDEVRLRALAADGPILLLFYLFDWSST